MTWLGVVLAFLLLLWTALLFVPFRWRPVGIYLFVPKALADAYLPFVIAAGILLALWGVLAGSGWMVVPAAAVAAAGVVVMIRVAAVRPDLAGASGPGWEQRLPSDRRARMLSRAWRGPLPKVPEPRVRRDVAFATVPGTERALLCDVWQPATAVPASGVTVVYLHGSSYYLFDKDFGTRPLFRQLTAQGHAVVDVAHRLFPETDVLGMVADAKRAVAWVGAHAVELGVDPDRTVLAGGSSGGHLALLAAYAHDDPALTPADLAGPDPRVCAVVSLYGQVGLERLYEHTGQAKVCGPDDPQPDWDAPPSRVLERVFGDDAARLRLQFMTYGGRCDWLVGGTPAEVPERYAQLSVLHHIGPDCPRTLLVHGTHDEMAPVAATRQLEDRLRQAGVPVTAVYLPHTDHAFDLFGATWSPAARVAIHDLERFLAVLGRQPSTTARISS